MSRIDTQVQNLELTHARATTNLDVLGSRSFCEPMVKSLGLFKAPEFLRRKEDARSASKIERAHAAVGKLLASYVPQRSGESQLIIVQAEETTPNLAARIANGVIISFTDLFRTRQADIIDSSNFHLDKPITVISDALLLLQFQPATFIVQLPNGLRSEKRRLTLVLRVMPSENRTDTPKSQRITAKRLKIEKQLSERTPIAPKVRSMHRSVKLLPTHYQTTGEALCDRERQRELVQPDIRERTEAELPTVPAWLDFQTAPALAFPAGRVLAFRWTMLRSAFRQQACEEAQVAGFGGLPTRGFLLHRRRRMLFNRQQPARFPQRFRHSFDAAAMRLLVAICRKRPVQDTGTKVRMIAPGVAGEERTAISFAAIVERWRRLEMNPHRQGADRSLGRTPLEARFPHVADGSLSIWQARQGVEGCAEFDLMAVTRGTKLTPRILHRFVTQILPQLCGSCDLIGVDAPRARPPAGLVRFGTIAEQVPLVARAGKISRPARRGSVEKLRTRGISVAGTVINNVESLRFQQLTEGHYHG